MRESDGEGSKIMSGGQLGAGTSCAGVETRCGEVSVVMIEEVEEEYVGS